MSVCAKSEAPLVAGNRRAAPNAMVVRHFPLRFSFSSPASPSPTGNHRRGQSPDRSARRGRSAKLLIGTELYTVVRVHSGGPEDTE